MHALSAAPRRIACLPGACALLLAAWAAPSHAVTGAAYAYAWARSNGDTTYVVPVNDTGQLIRVLGTDYRQSVHVPEVEAVDLPGGYDPSQRAPGAYGASHPQLAAIGADFGALFASGEPRGFRFKPDDDPTGSGPDDGWFVVTHYQTVCDGRALRFRAVAWSGRDGNDGQTSTSRADDDKALTPIAAGAVLASLPRGQASDLVGRYGRALTPRQLQQEIEQGSVGPLRIDFAALLPGVARPIAIPDFLALAQVLDVEHHFGGKGAGTRLHYVNFLADGDSRVTQVISDTPMHQQIVIDDCLMINAIGQDVPYGDDRKGIEHLAPELEDAVLTTVFSHALPGHGISAASSCALRTDDSGRRFDGACLDAAGNPVPASLDATACTNALDIVNDNGVLRCSGEKIPRPAGSYLEACSNVQWDGATLRAGCGPRDWRVVSTLDYAGQCRAGSTVSFDWSAARLRCDSPAISGR